MNRRSFLSSAIASVAALAIDPERLLWVPGKLISIPAPVLPPVNIDKLFGIDLEYTHRELLLSADDFRTRYLEPAFRVLTEEYAADVNQYSGSQWERHFVR